jgi:beta-mannosidase
MFACALYPTDPNFLKSTDVEIVQQVRRLQHHPSIALWAGIQCLYKYHFDRNKFLT